jgi:uncharacterized protein YneF (UPF0154 family)
MKGVLKQMKMSLGLAILLIVVALVIGILGTIFLTPEPEAKIIYKDKLVEVPVEVIKQVPMDFKQTYDSAVSELMKEVRKNSNLQKCDGDEYLISEISVKKSDAFDFSIEVEEDAKTIESTVKLAYKQDELKRCFKEVDFKVIYEEEEKPEVIIL